MYEWIIEWLPIVRVWAIGISAGIIAAGLRYKFVDAPLAAAQNNGTLPRHFPELRTHLLMGAFAGAIASYLTTATPPELQTILTAAAFVSSRQILGFSLEAARTHFVGNLTQGEVTLTILDRGTTTSKNKEGDAHGNGNSRSGA